METKLIYYGNPLLRQKAKEIPEITDEIRSLVSEMITVLEETKGIGLAAPQVNHLIRLFIIKPPVPSADGKEYVEGDIEVFINPKIIEYSEDTWVHSEGCLSIPKLYGDVERPVHIKVSAIDLDGVPFEREYSGWPARVILHENDHINGVLFIDRLSKPERKKLEPFLKQIKKKYKR